MASKSIRRRLHYGDLDQTKDEHPDVTESNALKEPLLGKHRHDENYSEGYDAREEEDKLEEAKKECLHWAYFFSSLILQWAQWLANLVIDSGALIRRLLPIPSSGQSKQDDKIPQLLFSPLQEERLRNLRNRLEVSFDSSCVDHQDALRQLWMLAYPNREVPPLKSELWKEMGWQGTDPSTDFRGGGFISLENLIFFANNYTASFHKLLHKQDGKRADWEYPFAVAGVNISFMLVQMLNLQSSNPTSKAGARFLELLGGDEMAFDNLYCVAFQLLDVEWLKRHASYMEFNEVLQSTRTQLERELAMDDTNSVEDLPAYKMLIK